MKILFVNACVRGAESNTLKLCRAALEALKTRHPHAEIQEVDLNLDRPSPLHPELAALRDDLRHGGNLSDPLFDYAKDFAAADLILIGAPYWDLSFPAILKIYLERICVVDITFGYGERGPFGLCRGEKLLYVTTAGGPVQEGHHLGYDYVKGLCHHFFGIQDTSLFALDALEMGGDLEAMVEAGRGEIKTLMETWL